jgi:hypothetical protein
VRNSSGNPKILSHPQQVSLSEKLRERESFFSFSLALNFSFLHLCRFPLLWFVLRMPHIRRRGVLSEMHISTKKINILQFFVSAHTDWSQKRKLSRDKKEEK